MRGMKVPKSLVLSLILLSGVALANWQLDLWKGGIWSDGKNITVEGNVTAKGDLSGVNLRLSGDAEIESLGGVKTVNTFLGDAAGSTTAVLTVPGTLPGDGVLTTIQNAGSTPAYVTKAVPTTNTVTITLSADSVTTTTHFVQVYRLVD